MYVYQRTSQECISNNKQFLYCVLLYISDENSYYCSFYICDPHYLYVYEI